MKKNIQFSIIICCYNSEKYLDETINSILNLNYTNWELIIIDDGSIDTTKLIINKYLNTRNNIKYFFQQNQGFTSARNLGIKKAKFEWIVIIDHDDICLPERLNIHNKQIINNEKAKLFFADTIHFSSENEIIRKNLDIFEMNKIKLNRINASNSLLIYGCFIDSESVVFSKQSALSIGLFNKKYKYLADYEFFFRFGLKHEIDFNYEIVSKWRVHANQATNKLATIYKKELFYFYCSSLLYSKISLKTKFILILRIFKNIIKIIIRR